MKHLFAILAQFVSLRAAVPTLSEVAVKRLMVFALALLAFVSTTASAVTGFLADETESTGLAKTCLYDVLGETYARTINSAAICPTTIDAEYPPKWGTEASNREVVMEAQDAADAAREAAFAATKAARAVSEIESTVQNMHFDMRRKMRRERECECSDAKGVYSALDELLDATSEALAVVRKAQDAAEDAENAAEEVVAIVQ